VRWRRGGWGDRGRRGLGRARRLADGAASAAAGRDGATAATGRRRLRLLVGVCPQQRAGGGARAALWVSPAAHRSAGTAPSALRPAGCRCSSRESPVRCAQTRLRFGAAACMADALARPPRAALLQSCPPVRSARGTRAHRLKYTVKHSKPRRCFQGLEAPRHFGSPPHMTILGACRG